MCCPCVTPDILFYITALAIMQDFRDNEKKTINKSTLDNSLPQLLNLTLLRPQGQIIERDMAQWLERGALPMLLPAVRFRIPLGAGFSEKYHISPLSILGHC